MILSLFFFAFRLSLREERLRAGGNLESELGSTVRRNVLHPMRVHGGKSISFFFRFNLLAVRRSVKENSVLAGPSIDRLLVLDGKEV